MKRTQLTTVTSYLADLTARLSKLSNFQSPNQLDQLTREDSFIEENINKSYKKIDQQNYLEYFQRILSNPLTYQVKLKKPINDPFSICQDLLVLTSVSLHPNKAIQKVLQEMIKNGSLYKKNEKNQLIKRPLTKVLERYRFLHENVQQQEIKLIVKWIEQNGLEKQGFIECTTMQEYQQSQLNIKIIGCDRKPQKKIENEKSKKRARPIIINNDQQNNVLKNAENQQDVLGQKTSRKKRKQVNELSIENSNQKEKYMEEIIANIFQTPEQKKNEQKIEPHAPQKPSKTPIHINNLPQQEKRASQRVKQRKFIRIIDSKKDVIIKQSFLNHNAIRKLNETPISKNKLLTIQIQTPKISQFVLYPKSKSQTQQVNEQSSTDNNNDKYKLKKISITKTQQQSESQSQKVNLQVINNQQKDKNEQVEQCQKLQNVLKQFQEKTKYTKIRILKYLDQLSGDLQDLRLYLETENKNLLWKRLEDAVLRKYCKEHQSFINSEHNKSDFTLKLSLLYGQLLITKGQLRINKRIAYLNLKNQPQNTLKLI